MLAFAGNSLLARIALVQSQIDPTTFSVVRLSSGAIFLLVFVLARDRTTPFGVGSWASAFALFVYALAFSFAYTQLGAGTGALILFGAVQATMLAAGFARGDRFTWVQWLGFVLACAGLVYLLLPGADAPAVQGTLVMLVAGIAWGVYSLRAGGADPVIISASNFARTLPFCVLATAFAVAQSQMQLDFIGLIYAMISGIVTSGIGYVIWYAVLPHISVINAATIQLCVPALAALMGVAFLGEALTIRLVVAACAILLGIGLVLRFRRG